MIGQSKINAFFKRQSASSEDRMKTAGSFCGTSSECTPPLKRKRDENKAEVLLVKTVVVQIMHDLLGVWSKRRQAKTATVKTATPKRQQTITATIQNGDSQNGDSGN